MSGPRLVTDAQREIWSERAPIETEAKRKEALSKKLHPIVDRVKEAAKQSGRPENENQTESPLISPWRKIAKDPESRASVFGRLVGQRSTAPAMAKTGIVCVDLETKLGNIAYSPGDQSQAIQHVARFWGNHNLGSIQMIGEDGEFTTVNPDNQEELLPVAEALVEQIEAAFVK